MGHRPEAASPLTALGVAAVTGFALVEWMVLRLRDEFARTGTARPARWIAGTLVFVILAGAIVLSLPAASKPIVIGQKPYQWRAHVVNCLFTATSATTLTGLAVYDTGDDFTPFGQTVVLVLMQTGALVMLLFGTVFGFTLNRSLRGTGFTAVDELDAGPRAVWRAVAFTAFATFRARSRRLGAALPVWSSDDRGTFWSIFHAVSALTNGGLALPADNFVPLRHNIRVQAVVLPLIVLGGLGAPVWRELLHKAFAPWRSPAHRSRRAASRPTRASSCS